MVLGGDNPEHREPFESFMKEYLQTGKNIILTNIFVGAETYPSFSAAFLIFLKKADPATRYDIYQQPSWFPAKSFILSGNHLTLSPIVFIPGEKELSRLQNKVQATADDFKEVVDYFQYTGEGEEVSIYFSNSDLTLLGRWRSGSGINHVFLAQFALCCCRCNFCFTNFFVQVTPPLFFGIWGNFLEVFKNFWKV